MSNITQEDKTIAIRVLKNIYIYIYIYINNKYTTMYIITVPFLFICFIFSQASSIHPTSCHAKHSAEYSIHIVTCFVTCFVTLCFVSVDDVSASNLHYD